MRPPTRLAAAAALVVFGCGACAEDEAAGAEAVEEDPFGDVIEVVTEEEAELEAEETITEENADEEFEKLKREIEGGD